MKIIYTKSKWEMWDDPLEMFIKRVVNDGFEGTELYFDSIQKNPPDEIKSLHEDNGLYLVGQILTEGENINQHLESFKRQADFALKAGSVIVNVHAGKDFFPFNDNLKLFEELVRFGEQVNIDFLVETHRGRPTYSLIETVKYLKEFPQLKLTADFSHWMVVHESDLSNQRDNLRIAIDRSFHIHARVGYEEGPQVTDPSAPEWQNHLNNHIAIWNEIINKRKTEGSEIFTITPEFGPPNYMHTFPRSNEPIGDTWNTNLLMRDLLTDHFRKDKE